MGGKLYILDTRKRNYIKNNEIGIYASKIVTPNFH